ncbi:MAG: PIG-L deacetylase family protein [Candidatus Hecatellaceae archaeon]
MKILVIGAHPDDPEIMCGGAIYLHRLKGDHVRIVVATDGHLGGDPEVRRKEAYDAAVALDVKDVTFLDLPEGEVTDTYPTIKLLEPVIFEFKPDIIYTHTVKDRHQDHRSIALATFSAARRFNRILTCETPATTPDFSPTLYVDISKVFSVKLNALKFHRSQHGKSIDLDLITHLARYRGSHIGVEYAEAFEPYKFLLF